VTDSARKRFAIDVSDEDVEDLRRRLAHVRWPDEAPGPTPWAQGSDLAYMKELIAYWRDAYDWRAQEKALNAMTQYTALAGGIDVHFVHEVGEGRDPIPLLLMHGWPGSFYEFSKVIPLLSDPGRHGGDPGDAFTVVAPSLPGYAFSFSPGQRRLDISDMAAAFVELMDTVLGHPRFIAAGSDWGARLTARLACHHADHVIGAYLTTLPIRRDTKLPPNPTAEQQRYAERVEAWQREERGYTEIQGTKPQTLAYALTDSPVGLAAWIVEKFRSWSDCGGDVERRFTKDELLTAVSIYWFTGAIGSSFSLYWGRLHGMWDLSQHLDNGARIEVPTGFVDFPGEIIRTPRAIVESAVNLQHWTTMTRGGHFAAFEEPELFVDDLRAFARRFRGHAAGA
jgi:pimeloyl-ACP methyl ester carboxylesterase